MLFKIPHLELRSLVDSLHTHFILMVRMKYGFTIEKVMQALNYFLIIVFFLSGIMNKVFYSKIRDFKTNPRFEKKSIDPDQD